MYLRRTKEFRRTCGALSPVQGRIPGWRAAGGEATSTSPKARMCSGWQVLHSVSFLADDEACWGGTLARELSWYAAGCLQLSILLPCSGTWLVLISLESLFTGEPLNVSGGVRHIAGTGALLCSWHYVICERLVLAQACTQPPAFLCHAPRQKGPLIEFAHQVRPGLAAHNSCPAKRLHLSQAGIDHCV